MNASASYVSKTACKIKSCTAWLRLAKSAAVLPFGLGFVWHGLFDPFRDRLNPSEFGIRRQSLRVLWLRVRYRLHIMFAGH